MCELLKRRNINFHNIMNMFYYLNISRIIIFLSTIYYYQLLSTNPLSGDLNPIVNLEVSDGTFPFV
jgi:hypothetical protein